MPIIESIIRICRENAHHIIETMFKGLGLALRRGLKKIDNDISSTKGML